MNILTIWHTFGSTMMRIKNIPYKFYGFTFLNLIAISLLFVWLVKSCANLNTTFTSIFLDFCAMITCIYTLLRVSESRKGDFKVLDMVTIYYAALFFLFSWFLKMLYNIWDSLWGVHQDNFQLATSVIVSVTLLINFYVTEKVNLQNIDKIDADM